MKGIIDSQGGHIPLMRLLRMPYFRDVEYDNNLLCILGFFDHLITLSDRLVCCRSTLRSG